MKIEKEQDAFEQWAVDRKLTLDMHPLHYLFLDKETNTARQAWKAALEWATAGLVDISQMHKAWDSAANDGTAFALVYIDADGEVQYKHLDPDDVLVQKALESLANEPPIS